MLGALASLLGVVIFGAVVPVVPTGAAVSAAAVLAYHEHTLAVVLVILVGAGGAYLGDLTVYWVCRWGGERLARRLRWLRDRERLSALTDRLRGNQMSVLLVSRLLPGGRVPVLIAAALMGLDWRRFAVVNAPACLLWSAMYAAIGLLGGAIFPQPWQGIVAAVVLVIVISQGAGWIGRRRAGGGRRRAGRTQAEVGQPGQ